MNPRGRPPGPPRTPFAAELARLGWSRARAAAFLQIGTRTAQAYTSGEYAAPHAVMLVLRAAQPDASEPAAKE